MLNNVKYVIYKDYGYTLNYQLLFDLYSPILGAEAINLYINLYHELIKNQKMNGVSSYLQNFYDCFKYSPVVFSELRAKLEAIGLIETFLQENENHNQLTYHFVIKQPLSFAKFIDNQKYRHLLLNAIGQLNYEKLEYIYMSERVPADSTNVSSTFEMVFDSESLNKINTFNFDNLYKNIAKNTSALIVINDQCKSIIENYYKNYNLSESEIEHLIYSCIVSNENTFEVDADLLSMKLHEYVTSAKNVTVFSSIKLHRNAAMFIKQLAPNEIQQIFNEYKNLNSEQYLSAIYKAPLSEEERRIIASLRSVYKLPDYIINLLVDFTIFKTKGKLNESYISKVAKTINGLNLCSLNDIYSYFRFTNPTVNKLIDNEQNQPIVSKKELIDWDNI